LRAILSPGFAATGATGCNQFFSSLALQVSLPEHAGDHPDVCQIVSVALIKIGGSSKPFL